MLFANYLPTNDFTSSLYLAAEADHPEGPFLTSNPTVNLTNAQPGDGKLFVDFDGTGYYVYTSIAMGHQIVVEMLTANYLHSKGFKSNVMSLGCLEAPSMIRHEPSELYFVFASFCCCYCGQGGDVAVFVADNPLGPFSLSSYINSKMASGKREIIIPAQQTNVLAVRRPDNGLQYIWIGDRWQSAPDHLKAHDFTYWGPLEVHFDKDGIKFPVMEWKDNFTVMLHD